MSDTMNMVRSVLRASDTETLLKQVSQLEKATLNTASAMQRLDR